MWALCVEISTKNHYLDTNFYKFTKRLLYMADRPILITIIAILTIIIALICILTGVGIVVGSEFITSVSGDVIDFGEALGAGILIIGLIAFVVGYGFLKGWTIFWYIGVIIYALIVLSSLYLIIKGQPISVIELVIALVILFYLSRPKVRTFFKV